MKNISVVYATKTQHSKKLAEAVGRALGVSAKNTEEQTEPAAAGLLFIAGGIYGGKCSPALLSYAEKLDTSLVKKVVLITSSASVGGRSQKELRELLMKKGIDVVDEITCTGAFLFVKAGHPSKPDIQAVAQAARDIAARIEGD